MISRFSQWAKENKLFLEDIDSKPGVIEPTVPAVKFKKADKETADKVRTEIDELLKKMFAKIKNDISNTFGKDIRTHLSQNVEQTKKVAVDYLNKALENLTGTKRFSVQESSYYDSAFNKLNRLFNETESITSSSPVEAKLGLTSYLDKMREVIMSHIDRMLNAMYHDKLHNMIQSTKAHTTQAIGNALKSHFPPVEPKEPVGDLQKWAQKGTQPK